MVIIDFIGIIIVVTRTLTIIIINPIINTNSTAIINNNINSTAIIIINNNSTVPSTVAEQWKAVVGQRAQAPLSACAQAVAAAWTETAATGRLPQEDKDAEMAFLP